MLTNKKLNPTLTGLITKRGKLNIFLVFIIQCYFSLSNTITSTYIMMEIKNKRGVQQIAFNHALDTDFEVFTKNILLKNLLFY